MEPKLRRSDRQQANTQEITHTQRDTLNIKTRTQNPGQVQAVILAQHVKDKQCPSHTQWVRGRPPQNFITRSLQKLIKS